jgi:hypothetical protein
LFNQVDNPDEPSLSAAILLWQQFNGSKVKKKWKKKNEKKVDNTRGSAPYVIFLHRKGRTCSQSPE